MEGERDVDSMRAKEKEGELFQGRNPVARKPHRLLIDRLC